MACECGTATLYGVEQGYITLGERPWEEGVSEKYERGMDVILGQGFFSLNVALDKKGLMYSPFKIIIS